MSTTLVGIYYPSLPRTIQYGIGCGYLQGQSAKTSNKARKRLGFSGCLQCGRASRSLGALSPCGASTLCWSTGYFAQVSFPPVSLRWCSTTFPISNSYSHVSLSWPSARLSLFSHPPVPLTVLYSGFVGYLTTRSDANNGHSKLDLARVPANPLTLRKSITSLLSVQIGSKAYTRGK